jgi:hypothetical protein
MAAATHRRSVTISAQRLTLKCALLALSCFGLAIPAHAVDPIGRASATTTPCPPGGATNGQCYRVTVTKCPGAESFYAGVKLNRASGSPIGAVLLTTGGGGNHWYDNDPSFKIAANCAGNCGLQAIQDLNAAGYITIQTNFSDQDNSTAQFAGWLTGSTTVSNGPRELACRYATVAHWAWTSLLRGDAAIPVCATGNSGGSAALAYALSHYGLGSTSGPGPVFTMAEITSGPPFSRLDHGCLGKRSPEPIVTCPSGMAISENLSLQDAENYVDPAYDGDYDCTSPTSCHPDSTDICGNSILAGGPADPRLLHDSILSDTDPPVLSFTTNVNVVFGAQDLTAAVPLGLEWFNAITSQKSQACVARAHHSLPGYTEGEQQTVADLKSLCK